jgi:pimeloyl-ACP methyl ester carboxylesterase
MRPPPPRFTRLGERLVCWRTQGRGPAAVLLHGSPQSSRALAGLSAAVAAAGLCAVMPDTPGAGHSEPLPGEALTIADLAAALRDFLDAIGLRQVALYGTHTGAAIACAFAALWPERVAALVLDGLAAWTADERAAYTSDYAPPFLPRWDGSHMTWLWSRMEAQSLFFPWHVQTAATWRGVDLSPPWHLHRNAMDMLEAGDAYRFVYQASLAFDPVKYPGGLAAARLMMLRSDVLRHHADRPALASVPRTMFDNTAALWLAVSAALAAGNAPAAPAFEPPGPFWRGTRAGTAKPLVLLHPAGASSRVFAPQLAAATHPTIALDLPGHGFDERDMPDTAAAIAALVTADCRTLGLDSFDVAGPGFGGVIAAAMASPTIAAPPRAPHPAPPDLATRGAVSLAPEWDGAHLLRAWRVAWRQALFTPWYNDQAPPNPPSDLTPTTIHLAALDLLRAGPAWPTANTIEAQASRS